MKAETLRKRVLAKAADEAGCDAALSESLEVTAQLLHLLGSKHVVDALPVFAPRGLRVKGRPTGAEVAASLCQSFKSWSSNDRRGATTDIEALQKFLIELGSASLSEWVKSVRVASASPEAIKGKRKKPVNKELVESYTDRLEKALRDPDAFAALYDALRGDTAVTQQDLAAIASTFVGKIAASASKKVSLERILSRHKSLMDFRAKEKAFGGRTAA